MERTYLARVRINSGGYDRSGSYFGVGAPVYRIDGPAVTSPSGVTHVRAWDRSDARKQALALFPTAKIRR